MQPIRIALSTSGRSVSRNATLVASILRRTQCPVEVKIYAFGGFDLSFDTDALTVQCIGADQAVNGTLAYPPELRIIRDALDWEKCLFMAFDQLVLCDLSPLFEKPMGDHVLAARKKGGDLSLEEELRNRWRKGIPAGYEHAARLPALFDGKLLNLEILRESAIWEKVLAAFAAFRADANVALTVGAGDRILELDRVWNLIPRQDCVDGISEGIIQWVEWPKPWHPSPKVWRADIWEAEECSWEVLRRGEWEKPLAWEIAATASDACALGRRGWKVQAFATAPKQLASLRKRVTQDLRVNGDIPSARSMRAVARRHGRPHFVRCGRLEEARQLSKAGLLPPFIAIKGRQKADSIEELRGLGYTGFAVLTRAGHPAGGPVAEGVDYFESLQISEVARGQELHACFL